MLSLISCPPRECRTIYRQIILPQMSCPPDQSTLTRGSDSHCAHDAFAYKYPGTHPLINMTYYMLYKANYKFIIIYAKYPNPPVQCPTSYKLNVHSFLQVSATSTRQQSTDIAPRQVSGLLIMILSQRFIQYTQEPSTHRLS